ncbi:hypothetical protein [Rhizobium sp. CF080]|uniref:hypothetical protein n=1 Tax=Rhizobium sp. (strain CF080) TaxID=1144310 RepID=UPI00056982B7|nr:hypothetical protein [Rhizobium sp. CF080]
MSADEFDAAGIIVSFSGEDGPGLPAGASSQIRSAAALCTQNGNAYDAMTQYARRSDYRLRIQHDMQIPYHCRGVEQYGLDLFVRPPAKRGGRCHHLKLYDSVTPCAGGWDADLPLDVTNDCGAI